MQNHLLYKVITVAILLSVNPVVIAQSADKPTNQDVQQAIRKGVEFLWTKQHDDGSWGSITWQPVSHPLAVTSMATYALMETGVSPENDKLKKALALMEKASTAQTYGPTGDSTYTMGFRCQMWLAANLGTHGNYFRVMKRDIDLIVASTPNGDYDYLCSGRPEYAGAKRPDNSNSQYALYGVWAGKLNSVAIPKEYWRKVLAYWMGSQNVDGGWGYMNKDEKSRIMMTAAGLASLYVCFDSLYGDRFLEVGQGQPEIKRAMDNGLAYLNSDFVASLKDPFKFGVHGWSMYYHLFGIQRVGLAGKIKRFGGADWYQFGANILLRLQSDDGSWPAVDGISSEALTSYALMFLARGQRPLPMMQLNYGGAWNNRPHAVSNLFFWVGKALERPCRAQVVKFEDPEKDWGDSNILLITGHEDPKFTEEQICKLRMFVRNGGTILTIAEGNGDGFKIGVRRMYEQLFPWETLKPLPSDHPMNNIHARLSGCIRFHGVEYSGRLLAIHTDYDLARDWQANQPGCKPDSFDAGLNIYLYANQKPRPKLGPASKPVKDNLEQWLALNPQQPEVASLFQLMTNYRIKLLQLERERDGLLKLARIQVAELLGTAIKSAAKSGKLDEATSLIVIREALEKGDECDLSVFQSPEMKTIRKDFDSRSKQINEACDLKLLELEAMQATPTKTAKDAVLRSLTVPEAGRK